MTSSHFDDLSFFGKVGDVAAHLVIPALVIATSAMAGYQRLMRGNMLEVLRAQYVLTARAKGLPENKVIYRHALRNAINPMITIFGFELSSILSGAALTEIITSWPGLGTVMLTAVRSQDLYLVMGSALIGGVLLIVGNLIADILLAWSDPRIQYQ
jgi:peptide/nickel transport system permease protein